MVVTHKQVKIEDFGESILMPGLIDCQVNLQDLAKEQWEGFEYGTKAAASGGVTTLVDMPIMKKPKLTAQVDLDRHFEAAQKAIKVDVAMTAYLQNDNLDEIPNFVRDGRIIGFFACLSPPVNRKLDEVSDNGLDPVLEAVIAASDPN